MNTKRHLPGYDGKTRRLELGAFLGLAMSALALIALVVGDSLRFSVDRSRMITALETRGAAAAANLAQGSTNQVLTNLSVIAPRTPELHLKDLKPPIRPS